MTAKILEFPKTEKSYGFKIPLYSNIEIEISLLCINSFSTHPNKITAKNLSDIDPKFVIESLTKGRQCQHITPLSKRIIDKILNNVEKISL
ncbi:MAG: hypothetical protein EBU90_07425 [Proteobacteria bacterium]|nr:hypothetical protein [Pseudomonadota bacterium]NBP13466.1 hypothetical protein [bacterium]